MDKTPESIHLGKSTPVPSAYDRGVLVAVPRLLNRRMYGLQHIAAQFTGYDIWHAYEVSFLTHNGFPVIGILKLVYPATTPSLVESKSLKLYLNSFNAEKMGDAPSDAIQNFETTVKKDLENLLAGEVWLKLHTMPIRYQDSPWDDFEIIEHTTACTDIPYRSKTENPALLQLDPQKDHIHVGTHLLKSNCKITHQPDWGSAYLQMKGTAINPVSFLEYVVSLRDEDHFHEEIAELMMKRVHEKTNAEHLLIACHYTRRGGIDINPIRKIGDLKIPEELIDPNQLTTPVFRQ